MRASILVCDRSCLERLLAEGGLRRSFLHIVEPELAATIDTVAGDGKGLDDALDRDGLVSVDHQFVQHALESARGSTQGQGEAARYASNFLPKLASVPSIWLELITAGGREQLSAIDEAGRRMADSCGAAKLEHVSLVLVLTQPVYQGSRQAIDALVRGDDGPIRRVYLMEHGLQQAQAGRRFVQSASIWPLYVARLLVALVALPKEDDSRSRRGVFAWRGFHVGTLDMQSVESQFRKQLREELLPTRQIASDRDSDPKPHDAPRGTDQSVGSGSMTNAQWSDHASTLERAFDEALCDDWFRTQLKRQGEARGSSGSDLPGLGRADENSQQVVGEWDKVAAKQGGPAELRRIAEGEGRASWFAGRVSALHESQRETWSSLIEGRLKLRQRRDALRCAAAELVEARKHHLPFAWRLYIALALLLGIAQFYGALLEPLRQAGASSAIPPQRSTLFGEPVEGSRIGFLIDRSVTGGSEQFDRAKEQLVKAVEALDASREFSLGAYSDDLTLMPECARGPIRAIEANKVKARAWIEGLKAHGEPDPSRAVEAIVQSGLDRIALVSSGTVVEGGVQRLKQLVEKAGTTLPPVDTITLPSVEEVPLLRELSGATKGRYQRVAFDPFAPIGFWATLFILVGLAALGAALGVMIPWVLERRSGDRETTRLQKSCETLREHFAANGWKTHGLFDRAAKVSASSARHALGAQQQQLAQRALAALEQVLDGSTPSEPDAADHEGDRLRQEDRNDVKSVLDVPVPEKYLPDAQVRAERIQEFARHAANGVSERWGKLCRDVDRESRGHLPVTEIMQLSDEFDRQADAIGSELVSNEGALDGDLDDEIRSKLTTPAGYPLLSAPVSASTTPLGHLLHLRFARLPSGEPTRLEKRLPKPYSFRSFECERPGLAGRRLVVEQIQLELKSDSSWGVKE